MNQNETNSSQEVKVDHPLKIQKETRINKDLREETTSPNEIWLDSGEFSQQEFELEAQTDPPYKGCLRSKIRVFWSNYCEITETASFLRKKWKIFLSIFVCSRAALDIKETEKLVSVLFLVSYICLSLQIAEDLIRCYYLKTASSGIQRIECIFDMANKAVTMLFILSFNLQYKRVISPIFMLLPLLLSFVEVVQYFKNPLISQAQDKDMKTFERVVYFLQSFMIAAKINNLIDLEWKAALVFLWLYLGIFSLYALLAVLLLVTVSLISLLSLNFQNLAVLRSRILGVIWHICYNGLNIVGLIILIGIFQKIDGLFQISLYSAQILSAFLLIYTTILFPILKRFNANAFESLGTALQNQVSQKKYTLIKAENDNERKRAFFLIVSSTYFSLVPDISQQQFEEMMQKNNSDGVNISQENNLCYICENNESDAILADCGHGGICCDCAVRRIEQKNECMGCRKPVKAIYKIESESKNEVGVIVQASEFVQVLEEG